MKMEAESALLLMATRCMRMDRTALCFGFVFKRLFKDVSRFVHGPSLESPEITLSLGYA